jgi:hypothetical protein
MATEIPKDLEPVIETILGEARGQGYIGMAGVARAIVNRATVRNQSLPEVVSKTTQFNGNTYKLSNASASLRETATQALSRAMEGHDDANIGLADHFSTPETKTSWTKAYERTRTVGGHSFYASPQALLTLKPGRTAIPTAKPAPPAQNLRSRATAVAALGPVLPSEVLNQPIEAYPERTIRGHTYPRSNYSVNNTRPEVALGASRAFEMAGAYPQVNSSFRSNLVPKGASRSYNRAVGGASQSEHALGNALDLKVTEMNAAERANLVEALITEGFSGFGFGPNIIHADMRKVQAQWTYGNYSVPQEIKGVLAERNFQAGAPAEKLHTHLPSFVTAPTPQAKPNPALEAAKMHAEEFQSVGAAQTAASAMEGPEVVRNAAESIQIDERFNIVPETPQAPAPEEIPGVAASQVAETASPEVPSVAAAAQSYAQEILATTPTSVTPQAPAAGTAIAASPQATQVVQPAQSAVQVSAAPSPQVVQPAQSAVTPASPPAPEPISPVRELSTSVAPTQPAAPAAGPAARPELSASGPAARPELSASSRSAPGSAEIAAASSAANIPSPDDLAKPGVPREKPRAAPGFSSSKAAEQAFSALADVFTPSAALAVTPQEQPEPLPASTPDLSPAVATAARELELAGILTQPRAKPTAPTPSAISLPGVNEQIQPKTTPAPMAAAGPAARQIDSPILFGPKAKPSPEKPKNRVSKNIGRGVGALAGTAVAGPVGGILGALLGARAGPAVTKAAQGFGSGFGWGGGGYGSTPIGQAVTAATRGGGFDNAAYTRAYALAGGGSDAKSYGRALAEEQRQRSMAGQKTIGDAFGF